jgi:hypothetical protein
MNAILLFLHLVGLMLGAAGGFATAVIMRRAEAMPPQDAKVVRGLGPVLANVSAAGLVLMWLTGLILVWSRWNGPSSLPAMFWVKAIFILSLTVVVGLIHHAYAEMRKGRMAAAARLPMLGPVAGASALCAVLFAVLAFSPG